MRYEPDDITQLEKRYRINLINGLSGAKSVNLIATVNGNGIDNLALFSSVMHIGSDPALIGFIMRPVHVPRHTYQNIVTRKQYTINAVAEHFHQNAHLCSANFPADTSEFEFCGIAKEYIDPFPIPFVAESPIRIACELEEDIPVQANGTRLIVGRILLVDIADGLVNADGYVDIAAAKVNAVSGNEGYHTMTPPKRYAYAKAFHPINPIP